VISITHPGLDASYERMPDFTSAIKADIEWNFARRHRLALRK
jgi:hypothetical protein